MIEPKRLLFVLLAVAAAACKKPAPVETEDAAPVASASTSLAAEDAGDPLADDDEFGTPPDAGCPIPVHPGYCRRSCKNFAARKISHHAARVGDSARYAIGTCDKLDVFAERDARDGGITEYYDSLGVLVAARDDRQRGCTDFGPVPKCDPVLTWKPVATVKIDVPTVTGNLPLEVIWRIVRSRFGALRVCYQSALDRDAAIHGTIVLSIAITASGSATVTKATGSTLADPGLATCTLDAMKSTSFPSPDPPGQVTATTKVTFGVP